MWLEALSLSNFRNFRKQEIKLGRWVNVFIGDNAQGKTNVIEAVYLLATSKSFRASKDTELIRWGESEALVEGRSGPNQTKLLIKEEGKKAFINKQPRRRTAVVGKLPVVLFSPESIEIVSGSPDKRRRFLDQVLSITHQTYLYTLGRYNKAVRNRNKVLFAKKQGFGGDLTVWDEQVATLGSNIWTSRLEFVAEANRKLKELGKRLVGSPIYVNYEPTPKSIKLKGGMKEYLKSQLEKNQREDILKLSTSVGPHRDDFKVYMEVFKESQVLEKEVGAFGSRGEQRMSTLALKLIEADYIEKNLGETPTLLLDDVLSEFDENNREHILALLPGRQSLMTTTSLEFLAKKFLKGSVKIFTVQSGKIESTVLN